MFQTASGVTIPFPEKIREQFQVFEGRAIRANISFGKLKFLLTEFYHSLPEPLFFVLQLPLSIQEERQLGHDKILHQDVCDLDGQTQNQIDFILNLYGQILLEDGISQFAVASHTSREELFIKKYKLIELYSPSPRRFVPLLQRNGLTETARLFTFSQTTPGKCRRIAMDGLDVYVIAERLKKLGMYRAKIIEDA